MDEWYHNGALVLWTNEDKWFNLFYNWFAFAVNGILGMNVLTIRI